MIVEARKRNVIAEAVTELCVNLSHRGFRVDRGKNEIVHPPY